MRFPSLPVVGLVVLIAIPARAQSVTLTNLVGQWRNGAEGAIDTTYQRLIFRSDSTFIGGPAVEAEKETGAPQTGRTRLRGDTLWFKPDSSKQERGFKATYQNNQLVLVDGAGTHVYSQVGPPAYRRLSVRPRELATSQRTDRLGEQRVFPVGDTLDFVGYPAMVYVPRQCAGGQPQPWWRKVWPLRCPLVVFQWSDWETTMDFVRPMADKYGMILAGSPGPSEPQPTPDVPDVKSRMEREYRNYDAMLKQLLQTYPIDPDKIAVVGTCSTGQEPIAIGGANFDVFSRIISLSAYNISPNVLAELDRANPRVEFLVAAGLIESVDLFPAVRELRRQGHRVTHAVLFERHGHQLELYDYVGRWLQESWDLPAHARRAPEVVADPLPLLTSEVLAKMTAFWARFVQEPEAIRMTARQAHLREVVVPLGKERPVLVMTDMSTLAAQYPSVAADLKAAGLTARQHDAYRVALASVRATFRPNPRLIGPNLRFSVLSTLGSAGPATPGSVLAKNIAFMETHRDEFVALEDATNGIERYQGYDNIWVLP